MNKIFASVLLMCVSIFSIGCSETIEPGNVGVPVLWGQVQDYAYPEGFHWVDPWMDIHQMTTRTQTYNMGGSGASDAPVTVRSHDQLSVNIAVSVQFHLNPGYANQVYRTFSESYADLIVHPLVRTSIRNTAANFTAPNLIDERESFQEQLEAEMRIALEHTLVGRDVNGEAIIIDNILIQEIDLPDSLDASIAAVQQQQQQTIQRQQALATAEAEAARLRTEAEGEAAARLIRATAEAEANQLLTRSLTREILELRRIEAMSELASSPTSRTIIMPAGGGSAQPILQMAQ